MTDQNKSELSCEFGEGGELLMPVAAFGWLGSGPSRSPRIRLMSPSMIYRKSFHRAIRGAAALAEKEGRTIIASTPVLTEWLTRDPEICELKSRMDDLVHEVALAATSVDEGPTYSFLDDVSRIIGTADTELIQTYLFEEVGKRYKLAVVKNMLAYDIALLERIRGSGDVVSAYKDFLKGHLEGRVDPESQVHGLDEGLLQELKHLSIEVTLAPIIAERNRGKTFLIYLHPLALSQTEKFLAEHGIARIPAYDDYLRAL